MSLQLSLGVVRKSSFIASLNNKFATQTDQ